MSNGQVLMAVACAFTTVTGLVLVITYSALAPWWRSHVGLMMMAYAMVLTVLSFLVLLTVLFGLDTEVSRAIRGTLILGVGLAMAWQTAIIIREQRKQRR